MGVDISAAIDWAGSLNDSLHVLTFSDERKQTNEYVRKFVQKTIATAATLPEDAQFSLIVDLRGRFFNSEETIKTLIFAAAAVARKTDKRDLCAACFAFCHATIPSIRSPS